MRIEVKAQKREALGTGASRRLRRTGKVPGILYGGADGPVNLVLDHKEMHYNLNREAFHASILSLNLDGKSEQVLLRAFNMHPFRPQVQHVDFQRVSKDKKIHLSVPLHFINQEISPGVKEQGGVMSHVMNDLEISCFPDDLPEFIEVDLGAMTVGHSMHARDLTLPKGVEAVLGKDENPVVATVVLPALVTEEETTTEAVAAGDVPTTEQGAAEAKADGEEDEKGKGKDK